MTDFTEFITGKNNTAILVGLNLGDSDKESLEELRQLAMSDQLVVVAIVEGRRSRPDPATYVGGGKIDEIYQLLNQTNASLVIFNHDLSPIQQRNLTERLQCQVIDRASLILDIFAQRAKSREGRLQVELAQLEYLASRLVRGWTHLERQKGGIGLRGPGETQLETDRRLLAKRVKYLREKLKELQRQRRVQRKSRQRTKVMSISIVGYTNAGKSTLFNSLTRAQAYAADQLFATLDTTTRRLFIPNNGHLVISDTVGFIRGLPHTLVAAFRATLEETAQADMLLHIVDAASPSRNEQIAEVNKLLKEIGAETIPQILVLNKIDLAESSRTANYVRDEYGRITCIRLSAKTGEGLEFIRLALAEAIAQNSVDLRENFLEVGRVNDSSATAFLEREEGLNYHGIK
ncbi:GTPase HflX [Nitrosomonas sp. Nm132]|jgi:GTP-binding protein HflX|uniref:GTPase HflX n=1 Tax=Nitrosomonas sp. Nm132 TaxID=1881053 RepID=UPI00087EA8AF|nr:GTPase HflX [Nitrosomonas sp. Nm132]SDH08678.1 GTP-binding protein HflX [Nitrosomonas sp. Nm132]